MARRPGKPLFRGDTMTRLRYLCCLTAGLLLALPVAAEENLDRGLDALKRRDYDLAISYFKASMRVDAEKIEPYIYRAEAYLAKGLPDKAMSDLKYALEIDPNSLAALKQRGRAFLAMSDPISAVQDFTRVLEAQPQDAQALQLRGEAYVAA